jgi:uncharacterized protein GlcG (DUF336 family)
MRRSLLHVILMALLLLAFPQSSWADSSGLLQFVGLPVDLASGLASVALQTCRDRGASVSVSVVDPQGRLQVMLMGDHASPHTSELSRHKAYTAVSLAALQDVHTTTELAEAMRLTKASIGLLPLPADSIEGITPVPGGVVLRSNGSNQLLAGLGVSGARQGQLDEQCALAAEQWLLPQLDQASLPDP